MSRHTKEEIETKAMELKLKKKGMSPECMSITEMLEYSKNNSDPSWTIICEIGSWVSPGVKQVWFIDLDSYDEEVEGYIMKCDLYVVRIDSKGNETYTYQSTDWGYTNELEYNRAYYKGQAESVRWISDWYQALINSFNAAIAHYDTKLPKLK